MQYLKTSLKMFGTYLLFVLVFVLFAGSFVKVLIENKTAFFIYCTVILFLYTLVIYSDTRKLGDKERKPYYNANPYPMKGFVLGLMAAVPIIAVMAVSLTLDWKHKNLLFYRLFEGFLAPFSAYEANLSDSFPFIYAIIAFYIPAAAGIGYLAGLKDFYIINSIKKLFGKDTAPVKRDPKKFR